MEYTKGEIRFLEVFANVLKAKGFAGELSPTVLYMTENLMGYLRRLPEHQQESTGTILAAFFVESLSGHNNIN